PRSTERGLTRPLVAALLLCGCPTGEVSHRGDIDRPVLVDLGLALYDASGRRRVRCQLGSRSEDLERAREDLHALHSIRRRNGDAQDQALLALENAEDAGPEPDAHDGPPVRSQLDRLPPRSTLAEAEEDRARAALLDVPGAAKRQRDETIRSHRDGLAAR